MRNRKETALPQSPTRQNEKFIEKQSKTSKFNYIAFAICLLLFFTGVIFMCARIYKAQIKTYMTSKGITVQFDAQEIIPRIYLGSYSAAKNKELLKLYGITHVLTVAIDAQALYPDDFQYMVIRAYDHEYQDLISYFDATNNFVKSALKNDGVVFIHCMAGVSRSTTMLSAYILESQLGSTEETLALIKQKRSFINPNRGFREQLYLYEKVLHERRKVQHHEILKYSQKAEIVLCLPQQQKD